MSTTNMLQSTTRAKNNHVAPLFLVAFLFLVVRPGAPSSVLAPSSDARSGKARSP